MEQFNVTGMTCAACQAKVEKAVSKVPGVSSCAVSLLTNSMGVEGDASAMDVIKAVEDAGYGASLKESKGSEGSGASNLDALQDKETPKLIKRLVFSVIFLAVLMYFSMGSMMFGWPLPEALEKNHIAQGIIQLLLSGIIMVINQRFFISGFKGLIHRSPNMDTLVALGATAAYGYSLYALFAMTGAHVAGDMTAAMAYMDEFYFESAGTILTLITVGKTLEAKSKGRTTDALKSLMRLSPQNATVIRDGEELTIPVAQVRVDDIFLVRPGEQIPVDGVIIEGHSAVDESALTGESIPVDKEMGDALSSGTLNSFGLIKCRATRVGEDTTLSKIIKMVSDAAATKAPIAKIADRVSGVFVPVVIGLAIVTLLAWMVAGEEIGFALARAICVLVISCPCALGLATPVAIMVGNGVGARGGILYKTAASLENVGYTKIVALDKTGTITKGEPKLTDIVTEGDTEKERVSLLKAAFSIERGSEHPLARAICDYCTEQGVDYSEIRDFMAHPGGGVSGDGDHGKIFGGNTAFLEKNGIEISDKFKKSGEELSTQGKTPMYFAGDGKVLGIIAVADTIKEESPEAIRQLQKMGIHVVMLTGDNEKTARAIGAEAGVNEVVAGVLPQGKEAVIRRLMEYGKVAMVGDGINDAPALTVADTGIAIGAGADVAIDAADVVLTKSRLTDVPAAIRLSRGTIKNIKENLFWAFIYNIIGIPLAAGVFIPLFGWQLNPMFGAAAMSLSSFCVVCNALRLNLLKIFDPKRDKSLKAPVSGLLLTQEEKGDGENLVKEDSFMEKTIKVTGMMCENCERHVQKGLMAIDGVEEAKASHEAGEVVIKLSKEVPDEVLKAAIIEEGYEA